MPRASGSGRVSTSVPAHRKIERSRGLPLLSRLLLVVAIGALGLAVFMTVTGGFGRIAGAVGATVDKVLADLTATPTPRPSVPEVADSPLLVGPAEPYTNQAAVDIVMTVPRTVVGDPNTVVRLYLALEGQLPAPILEVPVGSTPSVVIPDVALTPGRNDFTATLRGPAGESEPSAVVTYVLDQEPPPIEVSSPANGETINRAAATLVGRTQGRSTLVARNEANAASVTGLAGADGAFELVLPLGTGTNGIHVSATDPAGNVGELVLSVQRGTGALAAVLSVQPFRISAQALPAEMELVALVSDPDGRPMVNAEVTFTLSIPGIQVVTLTAATGGDGKAIFRTTVPAGATPNQEGIAAVLVRTAEFGETTDQTVVIVTE